MKQDIYRINGKATNKEGYYLGNLIVTIYDRDRISDDLLGIGRTDEKGEFRISFTKNEFNQDLFESEDFPDISIIFSANKGNELCAVYKEDFQDLKFKDLSEDLGDISIETWGTEPVFLENIDSFPGIKKRVKRLKIDDELVSHCVEEITPMVEKLTGWRELLEGISIKVVDDYSEYLDSFLKNLGIEEGSFFIKKFVGISLNKVMALYDPFEKIIYINKKNSSSNNLDALKVIIGHELVHVGQFRESPSLVDGYSAEISKLKELFSSDDVDIKDIIEKQKEIKNRSVMSKSEGYAFYIQNDFLQKHYNMATFFPHISLLGMVIQFLFSKTVPEMTQIEELKQDQYLEGRKLFADKQKDEMPVRFDST